MTEAVYRKSGCIVFPQLRLPLIFSLTITGLREGYLLYGNRRSRITHAKTCVNFTGMKDGDYPILLTDGVCTFTVGSVRKAGDELLDLSQHPELTAELCERLSRAEQNVGTLQAQVARLAEKIGTEEIFTL